jgi:hypothetical protein
LSSRLILPKGYHPNADLYHGRTKYNDCELGFASGLGCSHNFSRALIRGEKPKLLNNKNFGAVPVLYLFFLPAVAFRIIAAHLVASASDSNPKTAEYFLPTTWAKRKSMLMPALAMACAVA